MSYTYKLAVVLINAGKTDSLSDLLGVLLLGGSLTQDEYTELVGLMAGATA